MQPGDVPDTYADVSALANDTGYSPKTDLSTGIQNFVSWYHSFFTK
jgi:UDP-glucuronate 4-epimerase